jgi:hypothetical protein
MKVLKTYIVCTDRTHLIFNKVYECLRDGELERHYFLEIRNSSGGVELSEITKDRANRLVSIKFPSELVPKKVCPNLDERGNCPLHNLHCAYPDCEK